MTADLSPIHAFGDFLAKREDGAGFIGLDRPSGAKVRAYARMIENNPPGLPLVVGCGSASAIQVYLADAAIRFGRDAYVVVPARKHRHPSTQWAIGMGADVTEVRPGYPSVVRARARELHAHHQYVHWDQSIAMMDTAEQCQNVPPGHTIVVAAGSGLIAAGIIGGLARLGRRSVVRVVGVSPRATTAALWRLCATHFDIVASALCPVSVSLIPPSSPFGRPFFADLPDGTPLDPYYTAKALAHTHPGDLLWVTGRRPLAAA